MKIAKNIESLDSASVNYKNEQNKAVYTLKNICIMKQPLEPLDLGS